MMNKKILISLILAGILSLGTTTTIVDHSYGYTTGKPVDIHPFEKTVKCYFIKNG